MAHTPYWYCSFSPSLESCGAAARVSAIARQARRRAGTGARGAQRAWHGEPCLLCYRRAEVGSHQGCQKLVRAEVDACAATPPRAEQRQEECGRALRQCRGAPPARAALHACRQKTGALPDHRATTPAPRQAECCHAASPSQQITPWRSPGARYQGSRPRAPPPRLDPPPGSAPRGRSLDQELAAGCAVRVPAHDS
jgi:hypothetical protein